MVPVPLLIRWLKEPLLQFLVMGALLFGVFQWRGGGGPASNRIVITPGQVDAIIAGFARTWQRQPTDEELKAQLDEHIRDEIATREALAMGLDRDDTIIRRRLRQKLEFLTEDALDLAPATDADLEAWLAAHPDLFRLEPQVSFRQVFLSPDRRGTSLDKHARALRERLAAAGPDVTIDTLGDSSMVPSDVALSTRGDVARLFGESFADEIVRVEPGRWAGPIRSGYGLHVVFLSKREAGRQPALADVRPRVEREFTADRRRRQLEAMYAKLLERYRVVVERRPASPPAAPSKPPEGSR
jgi:hypothetical protein